MVLFVTGRLIVLAQFVICWAQAEQIEVESIRASATKWLS